jgi:hypothetical protein
MVRIATFSNSLVCRGFVTYPGTGVDTCKTQGQSSVELLSTHEIRYTLVA